MMLEHATSNGMRTILSGRADKTGARRGHVRPINYVDCVMSAELTMYTTSWCGYCVRLKKVLKAEGIAFAEVDIEADPAAARVRGIGQRWQPDGADAEVSRRQHADQPERRRGQEKLGR